MAREVRKYYAENPITRGGKWKGAFNFEGTILQIIVVPSNPNCIYSFGIKDEDQIPIFVKYSHQGLLIEPNLDLILFPGDKNIIIESANMDITFRIKFIYKA